MFLIDASVFSYVVVLIQWCLRVSIRFCMTSVSVASSYVFAYICFVFVRFRSFLVCFVAFFIDVCFRLFKLVCLCTWFCVRSFVLGAVVYVCSFV